MQQRLYHTCLLIRFISLLYKEAFSNNSGQLELDPPFELIFAEQCGLYHAISVGSYTAQFPYSVNYFHFRCNENLLQCLLSFKFLNLIFYLIYENVTNFLLMGILLLHGKVLPATHICSVIYDNCCHLA